jgi:CspA family cold shock protein
LPDVFWGPSRSHAGVGSSRDVRRAALEAVRSRDRTSKVDERAGVGRNATGGFEYMNGTVKWFNDAKGYGFIRGEDGQEVFVHHTAIQSQGFRSLAEGQKVRYEVKQGPKGLQAEGVETVS